MSNSRRGLAVDNVNEIYNFYLKCPVATNNLGTTCERSRHVITGRRCSNDLWGAQDVKHSTSQQKASVISAVERTEIVLHRSGVFASHVPESMSIDTFWMNVVKPRKCGSNVDRRNESCVLSLHEQTALNIINTIDRMETELESSNDNHDNDEESVGSCTIQRSLFDEYEPNHDENEAGEEGDVAGDEVGDPNVLDAVEYLKQLGKMKKIPLNRSSLDDISEVMRNSAETYITKERHKYFRDTERNADLIDMAITNYNQMMSRRRERIGSLITEDTHRHVRQLSNYQKEYDRLFSLIT
jgi:Mg2+ and Co2+ transporter CorA